ncbi:MAG: DUF72 domain-containing protein, partial [Gallionellaceae bacterium]
ASVPTLKLFDFQYNKFGFSVSSATLLLLTQILVCCIDRLNPQFQTWHFYRLPSQESFAAWRDCTPDGSVFGVKASRSITHMKKLKGENMPLLLDADFAYLRLHGPRAPYCGHYGTAALTDIGPDGSGICSGRKFAPKFLLHGVDLGFQAAAWPGPVIDLDVGFNPIAVRPHGLETGSHDGHHFGPFAFDDGTHGSKLIG